MTRVKDAKRATRRVVEGMHGEYHIELRPEGLLMRPLRTRRGGPAEVLVRWESIYAWAYYPRPRRRGAR